MPGFSQSGIGFSTNTKPVKQLLTQSKLSNSGLGTLVTPKASSSSSSSGRRQSKQAKLSTVVKHGVSQQQRVSRSRPSQEVSTSSPFPRPRSNNENIPKPRATQPRSHSDDDRDEGKEEQDGETASGRVVAAQLFGRRATPHLGRQIVRQAKAGPTVDFDASQSPPLGEDEMRGEEERRRNSRVQVGKGKELTMVPQWDHDGFGDAEQRPRKKARLVKELSFVAETDMMERKPRREELEAVVFVESSQETEDDEEPSTLDEDTPLSMRTHSQLARLILVPDSDDDAENLECENLLGVNGADDSGFAEISFTASAKAPPPSRSLYPSSPFVLPSPPRRSAPQILAADTQAETMEAREAIIDDWAALNPNPDAVYALETCYFDVPDAENEGYQNPEFQMDVENNDYLESQLPDSQTIPFPSFDIDAHAALMLPPPPPISLDNPPDDPVDPDTAMEQTSISPEESPNSPNARMNSSRKGPEAAWRDLELAWQGQRVEPPPGPAPPRQRTMHDFFASTSAGSEEVVEESQAYQEMALASIVLEQQARARQARQDDEKALRVGGEVEEDIQDSDGEEERNFVVPSSNPTSDGRTPLTSPVRLPPVRWMVDAKEEGRAAQKHPSNADVDFVSQDDPPAPSGPPKDLETQWESYWTDVEVPLLPPAPTQESCPPLWFPTALPSEYGDGAVELPEGVTESMVERSAEYLMRGTSRKAAEFASRV